MRSACLHQRSRTREHNNNVIESFPESITRSHATCLRCWWCWQAARGDSCVTECLYLLVRRNCVGMCTCEIIIPVNTKPDNHHGNSLPTSVTSYGPLNTLGGEALHGSHGCPLFTSTVATASAAVIGKLPADPFITISCPVAVPAQQSSDVEQPTRHDC